MIRSGLVLSRRVVLGALGTLPLRRLARGEVAHRLTLLHINDFHSRHEPVNGRALSCAIGGALDNAAGCYGGSARLAAAIGTQRRAAETDGRAVLLLDGGDQFQGSLFFGKYRGLAELAVQHAVGTDAMAVGNHEFDGGPATLGRYAEAARFPLLAANIDAASEPSLAGRLRRFAVLDRGGLRIGLVGLTTLDTLTGSSPGPSVRFLEPTPALAGAVADARGAGAQLVVLLSHMGVGWDRAQADPGVAVIIGGHSHTLLSNSEAGAASAHPTVAGALVVQAGAFGRYLGRLDLDVDAGGRVLAYGGDCVHVGPELAPDPAVQAIVAGFAAPLDAFRNEVVATLPEELGVALCRLGPCRLGQAVAEAILAATPRAQVAIMNAGGLRTGLPAGPVTRGQVLEALPFGNTVATLTLRGADLEDAVRHGLGQVGRGGFPQVAGLRLEGGGLAVRDGDRWAPLDPAAAYIVATNNFLRGGGDGYIVLRDRAIDPYDAGPGLDDVFVAALTR